MRISGSPEFPERLRARLLGALLAAILLSLAACDKGENAITVGSKNFGESAILANMFAILAREKGLTVKGPIEYPTTQDRRRNK
jgi:glycine betaine/choline ABC-type transport system substrate-binding protein